MEILHKNISSMLESFINQKIILLKKPINYLPLDCFDGEKSMFAGLEELSSHFNLYLNENLPSDVFECNVAHELLHAVQYTKKYPYIVSKNGNEPEESFATSFRSLVLDLEVEDELKDYGFDASYFYEYRFEKLKEKVYNQLNDIKGNDYMEKITAVNFALSYLLFSKERRQELINIYSGNLDVTLAFAMEIVKIINKVGYSSREQVLICQGEINSLLDLWDRLNLFDGECNIYDKSQYRIWTRELRKRYLM